jgi:hypothetical protein
MTSNPLPKGTPVTVTARVYDTTVQGVLLDDDVFEGAYSEITIKRADGSLYRTEGRAWRQK